MKSYYVYFYYSTQNELLYVGKTIDVFQRWQGHNEPWKKDVRKIGIREYPDHASMDILEHYYIAKLEPKYNCSLLHHGPTRIELNDPITEEFYNLDEFEKKYASTTEQKKPRYNSYDEELIAQGFKIIETDKVNLLDPELIKHDISKIKFKHQDLYLDIGYRSTRKSDPSLNELVNALRKTINEKALFVEHSMLLRIGLIYCTRIHKDNRGKERACQVYIRSIFDYDQLSDIINGLIIGESTKKTEFLEVTNNTFVIDLSKIDENVRRHQREKATS